MAFPYIPKVVYPANIDSDSSLYKVYNSAETILSEDLEAWATTINIKPAGIESYEIWADNGYVNISGELIYYSSVEKDYATNKVYRLLNCIRNLSGEKPVFNKAGTPVRGYVVAEHHNQLAQALVNLESFVGVENSGNLGLPLDYKIRIMDDVENLGDDALCVQVSFNYFIVDSDPLQGTTIQYSLTIVGKYDNFTVDFGDGTTDSFNFIGVHTYAANFDIDPFVVVNSKDCQVVQVAPERTLPSEPQPVTGQTITSPDAITIPSIPDFPNLTISTLSTTPIRVNLPPIIFPCFDIGPLGPIVIPSTITLTNPDAIPSTIQFLNPNAIPSTVAFLNSPRLPSTINFNNIPNIPSTISLQGFYAIPSNITINPVVVDLASSEYCVNCTPEFPTLASGDGTAVWETEKGCDTCPSETQTISKVQVVVHDFYVESEYGTIPARYDLVKILIQDPSKNTCLIMGGGKADQYPKYSFYDTITLTFDDDSPNNIYDFDKVLKSQTYKPNSNGNGNTKTDGIVALDGAAPEGPYGTALANFADKPANKLKWRAYVVVGVASPPKPEASKPPPTATADATPFASCPPKGFAMAELPYADMIAENKVENIINPKFKAALSSPLPTPTPTPGYYKPLETPSYTSNFDFNETIFSLGGCTGKCTWQAVIIGLTQTKPPSPIWGWVKTADNCSANCYCNEPDGFPQEGSIEETNCNNSKQPPNLLPVPTETPIPNPFTICRVGKICIRVYYNQLETCPPTPRPSVGPTYTACPQSFGVADGYTYEEIKELQKNYTSVPEPTPLPTPMPENTNKKPFGDSKTAIITKPRLCSYAGRKPLEMVKKGCGQCAIRSCDIYGLCSHTQMIASRPEVVCCQNCPSYTLTRDVNIKPIEFTSYINPNINLEPDPNESRLQSKMVMEEIEIPVEYISIPNVPEYHEPAESDVIEQISPLQILQKYLDQSNKVKMAPKDSIIKIDVNDLLGDNDEKTT